MTEPTSGWEPKPRPKKKKRILRDIKVRLCGVEALRVSKVEKYSN